MLIIISLILFVFFSYRFVFCYTILPTGSTGNLKHKVDGVQYFPRVIFNPFKKSSLIEEIQKFNRNTLSKNDEIKRAKWWSDQISKGKFELASIKTEENLKHILVRHESKETTIVFVQSGNSIIRFY